MGNALGIALSKTWFWIMCLLVVSLAIKIVVAHNGKKSGLPKDVIKKNKRVVTICTIAAFLLIIIPANFTIYTAFTKGATQNQVNKSSITKIEEMNNAAPVPTQANDVSEFYGKIVYFYKYGCPYCDAIAKENPFINQRLSWVDTKTPGLRYALDTNRVVYVNIDSDIATKILHDSNINIEDATLYAPAVAYISGDGSVTRLYSLTLDDTTNNLHQEGDKVKYDDDTNVTLYRYYTKSGDSGLISVNIDSVSKATSVFANKN